MTRIVAFLVAAIVMAPALAVGRAEAANGAQGQAPQLSQHPQSGYYRGGSRMRGRVGGYSYSYQDAITDPRDESVYQDPELFRQSDPFDSGFFFDSDTAGGPVTSSSPYPN